ncbi:MAG: cytochrome c maturation protein CcmE [Flavobacteriales bacterium]|jgi:cytochrome c-type biogenesis protein CcmE|nr:cytochrome c maturation protein CcmE [Flavobacteriales bacterium]MBK6754287.1 cytochrome c maturation protein CcmE [Flavobacteriales bacterium]MBK7086002.1 cytochrome c maturation protein CcmE [Flavobacteriales bacterium]MBK7269637.1 cytochrome c maturation protein CcmE [Flavobacteriales bacterium]MBK7753662.1 cytochrome c maturation protein CcmE [Flavobacteriales bacterium]
MKRTHIIAIALIAVAIAALIGSLSDSSTYADLSEAIANPGREYHVVGVLDRSQEIIYEPSQNASLTQFTMQDLEGRSCRVKLAKAKPQDFERSERIVLIGEASADGEFHARDMLMKCPSKYNEQNKVDA